MNVTVDEDKCCGAGTCVLVAPDVFDQGEDDGIVILLNPRPTADQQAAVREAASVCPAAAIHLSELASEPSAPSELASEPSAPSEEA